MFLLVMTLINKGKQFETSNKGYRPDKTRYT